MSILNMWGGGSTVFIKSGGGGRGEIAKIGYP